MCLICTLLCFHRIEDLRRRDIEKRKLEKAKNELESFIVEAQDRLYQTEYEKCSKEEERVEMQSKLSLASDWLYEQEDSTPRKVGFVRKVNKF